MSEDNSREVNGFVLGEGIADAMDFAGVLPASDECYVKNPDKSLNPGADAFSIAFSEDGEPFVYLPSLNKVFRLKLRAD